MRKPLFSTCILHFSFFLLASLLLGCQPAPVAVEEPSLLPTATPAPTGTSSPALLIEEKDGAEPQALCEEGGTIQTLSLESQLLHDVLRFTVYFPPCYRADAAQVYPVIYLLHGQWQNTDLWQSIDLQAAADALILDQHRQPFLVVMPYEEYYFRSMQNNRYPDAILQELLPWVEENLSACAERDCRAIGGISRGAAWAVHLAFQNPAVFGTLGAHSMPASQEDLQDLPDWVDAAQEDMLPRIYADVGSSDPAVKDASAFDQALNALGVAHEWHLYAGRHNEEYWQQHLPDYLSWYTRNWMEE